MTWTYSGIFVERKEGVLTIYASDKHELDIFTDDVIGDIAHEEMLQDGLYQCLVGYGSMQEPTVYTIKKIADINWEMKPNGK